MQDQSKAIPPGKHRKTSAASETHITVDELGLKFQSAQLELAALKESERVRSALFTIFDQASSADDLKSFCAAMHKTIMELMRAENAYIAVYDAPTATLRFPYFADEKQPEPGIRPLGNGLTDFVFRTGEPFLLSQAGGVDVLRRAGFELSGQRPSDWLGVPLKSGKDVLGVLAVQSYAEHVRFGAKEKELLLSVSRHAAIALERKLAQQRLRDSEHRNRALLQAIPDLMFVLSKDGYHLDFKAARAEDLAVPPAKIIGSHIDSTGFTPESLRDFKEAIAKAISTGSIQTVEYTLATPRGVREWEARLARLDDDKALVITHDVTERKRADEEHRKLEAQILQAQKLESLGVLAGGIAHDFNNLLVGILGNADLALMDVAHASPAREHIEDIKKASIRASELTNQMLAYSGKGRFVTDLIDLNKLIQEITHLLQVSISKRAVLKYNFTENLPLIEGDPTQVRQVVMNLIINASDAIGERSGIISLSTGVVEADHAYFADAYLNENLPSGYYAYIEVSDTGCGMDEETQGKIFDPFFTTKFTGRGLGLAAALGIARGHRGAIKVRSEPNKGATFTVLFPCASETTTPVVREDSPPARSLRGSGTVLVVDDEESVRNIAKIMLERHGFTVITALDGRDGVRVFRENAHRIDGVVLDMTMPHMSGDEAFVKMQEIKPGVRILLASGYTEQDATRRFQGLGLAGFIHKPFQLLEFVEKVCAVVGAGRG